MLHLTGYELTMDDLKSFRQLGSKTPGHPENTMTKGVECTTGPLGQGVAMSVGFATASQFMGENHSAQLFDQKIFALCGDGDMQAGGAARCRDGIGHSVHGGELLHHTLRFLACCLRVEQRALIKRFLEVVEFPFAVAFAGAERR